MEVVAATLDGDVNVRAGRVALLRVELVGLDLELLHGLGRRREADTAIECIVGRAVKRDVVGACATVGAEGCQVTVRSWTPAHARISREDYTWRESGELIGCAVREGQLADLLPRDNASGADRSSF